jgi:glycosyltransferase involved in cell wall biosynthesis
VSPSLRVLVATTVHHPLDTRIYVRQIRALVDAGYDVTYAAPFAARAVTPPPGVKPIELPRAATRHRLGALRAARRVLREQCPNHDVVIIHDPELLIAAMGIDGATVVWDVHEDVAASTQYKSWIPTVLRSAAASSLSWLETWAERRHRLLLAEASYADRFDRIHPVVPNSTVVVRDALPSGPGRAVCVSTLTRARGAFDVIEAGCILRQRGIVVDVIGPAEPSAMDALYEAHRRGDVRWHGRLSHTESMNLMQGATAGLSLLHDEHNYRFSQPTKVLEYMAYGIPVVATPLPLVAQLVQRHDAGLIVPFRSPRAVADAVSFLDANQDLRVAMGQRGLLAVEKDHNWDLDAPNFVSIIEKLAREGSRSEASIGGSPSRWRRLLRR